jgi:phosphosulfolactate synthase (CoM biosynthesis protein A)
MGATGPNDPTRAFAEAVPIAELPAKPRRVAQTEIRNAAMGMHQIEDLTTMFGDHIDSAKWTCATQGLVPREMVRQANSYLRDHQIDVSTGGLLERVSLGGPKAVHSFLDECSELRFSIVEVSSGLAIMPLKSKLNLVKAVMAAGLTPKPEVAMTYGMNDNSVPADIDFLLREVELFLEAGVDKIMIEEDGVFRYVAEFNAALVHRLVRTAGTEHLMFEASDRKTAAWLLGTYGPEVNLFVDPRELPYVAAYRSGIWGDSNVWGRMTVFRED